VGAGDQGFARALVAASPRLGSGRLLAAFEVEHNDGPWTRPDDYHKLNGVIRYSRGDAVNSFSITGMAYHATWDSTDQVPQRAIDEGLIGRFGAIDNTDGGDTSRYSGSLEWQRGSRNASTKVVAYGIGYNLNLFSNFTYFLDDPVHGDQFHQADHRFITGAKVSHRRLERWFGHEVQNTFGIQLRNDDIPTVGLYHTQARRLLETIRQDAVVETSAAAYAQNETVWTPWLRTIAGARVDGYRFQVEASDPENGGTRREGIVSPKGGVVIGPFKGTEFYVNGGFGFHLLTTLRRGGGSSWTETCPGRTLASRTSTRSETTFRDRWKRWFRLGRRSTACTTCSAALGFGISDRARSSKTTRCARMPRAW
jgi:hypothetical protein